nr:hypothetical protein [Tanacetum cinerariifolium]
LLVRRDGELILIDRKGGDLLGRSQGNISDDRVYKDRLEPSPRHGRYMAMYLDSEAPRSSLLLALNTVSPSSAADVDLEALTGPDGWQRGGIEPAKIIC